MNRCVFSRRPGELSRGSIVTRRELIRVGGGFAAISAFWAYLPPATAASTVQEALDALLAGKGFVEPAPIRLGLPERFDYGNTVPLALTVDGPMTEANHVQRVSVFAEGNPFPEVAAFHFTPDSGRARVSTRIRLNEGEHGVVAVAELSDGSAWVARRTIEVAVSGCSTETGVVADHLMPRPEPRLKMPARARRGEIIEINTMISHWMETGLRIDAAGNPIPRRIINRMVCSSNGEPIFAADLSPAIAANAYLSFSMVARKPAVLTFAWAEDGGAVYRITHSLTVV